MRARRPGGRQRRIAVAAEDEAAQRKVLVEVPALWQPVDAVETILNLLVGLERDQRLVLAFAQADTPLRRFDVPGIERLFQNDGCALVGHAARRRFREERIGLQETLDVCLSLEAARGVAFERFGHDRGDRLIAFEHLAASGNPLIAIADGRRKHRIAILQARPHPVLGLLAILLPLVLGNRGEEIFDED
ncbi:hypothetical protein GTK09_11830 [Jiella sp. 40Bstr34]|uniref:Uncharacterized protein n=1 Tax=Jiella pacifica TaxID=2696469 RepID=A0A6N9T4X9_9HYPH|nr:hypothetical protein [Jiella pacifica]NDW05116.1 hypothetical protein [Jiella pacifica]